MQKYHVVIPGAGPVSVEGQFEVGPTNVLYIKNGNEVLQAFAPGGWVTIFKAPPGASIARPDAAALQAVRDKFNS